MTKPTPQKDSADNILEDVDGLTLVGPKDVPLARHYTRKVSIDTYGYVAWEDKPAIKCHCGVASCESCKTVFNAWATDLIESTFAGDENICCITFRVPVQKGSTTFLKERDDLINLSNCLLGDKKIVGVLDAIVDSGVNAEDDFICAIYGLLICNTVEKAWIHNLKSIAEDFPHSQLKLTYALQGGWREPILGDRVRGTIAPAEFTSWCATVDNFDLGRTDEKDKRYRSFLSRALHKDRIFFINVPDIGSSLSQFSDFML